MKKFSFSILLGIISFLSIYASNDIEFPVIDLTCHYKGADNTIEDNRPRTLVTSPVVYNVWFPNYYFERSRSCLHVGKIIFGFC